MLSFLLNTFITSVYICIGLLVKLYNCLLLYRQPPDKMKLTDLNTDCLLHIIARTPLETRLQTYRLVCSHWTKTVESLSSRQKRLILQLGTGNQWNEITKNVKSYNNTLIKIDNTLYTLNVKNLTKDATDLLTSTFPRLKTLVVIASDSTEDLNFLINLPLLISAYSHFLTTLQLFWDVKSGPFQANFERLITSINSLYGLKRLSFVEVTYPPTLQVPLFDLPLLRSLDKLDFLTAHFNREFVPLWSPHLQARKQLMKINFVLFHPKSLPPISSFSANVAAHFQYYSQSFSSLVELKNFCNIFTNLEMLVLKTFSISFAETITQLANLSHLSYLYMIIFNNTNELFPQPQPQPQPPPLTTVKRLYLFFSSRTSFNHTFLEKLNLSHVYPNVQRATLYLQTTSCADCGWQINVRQTQENRTHQFEPVDEQTVEQIKRCLTKIASLHTEIFKIEIRKNSRSLFRAQANLKEYEKKLSFVNLLN